MRRLALKYRHLHDTRRQKDRSGKKGKRQEKGPRNVLTPEERKERDKRQENLQKYTQEKIAEAREAIREITEGLAADLGKSPTHWHRCLMQLARISLSERATSWWNAFLSIRLQEINAGKQVPCSRGSKRLTFRMIHPTALPEGEKKKGVDDKEIMIQLRAEWEAMSEQEQEAFTKERVKQIAEDRKTKVIGAHTVATNAFHDTSSTIVRVENTVS